MGDFVDDTMIQLVDATASALDLIRPEVVAYIRETLATPGSSSPPVHSSPGEPPYRITGQLQESIDTEIRVGVNGTDTVSLTVSCTVDYGWYLEQGTPVMAPRPFIQPALEYWGAQIPVRLAELLGNKI